MKTLNLTNDQYRAKTGIANSDLQMIERSAADYKWSQEAPRDPSKVGAFDYGTALHLALLEPEKFNSEVVVYSKTKTRTTKDFIEFEANTDGLILLESEYDKLKFTVDGAKYHPTVNRLLTIKSDKECSIFVDDAEYNIARKIRPDLDYIDHGLPMLGDVKTTEKISDWRESAQWKNPLFTHGYGHTAAYYMDTASIHHGFQINNYTFIVIQKHVEMGRYPVAAINISRAECEALGFFDQIHANLHKYAKCLHSNNWDEVERFECLAGSDEITIEDA